ncbi:hypothetical protein WMY93_014544 [Mugilogobius chulae]|uniref:Uncharacterized protein n=1 Tax=Mugilogobius chulae TaxID=88201 RepID=A0AAW0P6U9_9GOBI
MAGTKTTILPAPLTTTTASLPQTTAAPTTIRGTNHNYWQHKQPQLQPTTTTTAAPILLQHYHHNYFMHQLNYCNSQSTTTHTNYNYSATTHNYSTQHNSAHTTTQHSPTTTTEAPTYNYHQPTINTASQSAIYFEAPHKLLQHPHTNYSSTNTRLHHDYNY